MKKLALSAALTLSMCAPAPAHAQMVRSNMAIMCGPPDMVMNYVTNQKQESLIFAGIASDGDPVYLAFNPETKTWSIFFTTKAENGVEVYCGVAAGTGGAIIRPEAPSDPN